MYLKKLFLFQFIFVLCLQSKAQNSFEFGFLNDSINQHVYKTIKLGNQTWMAENLRSTKFQNGKQIQLASDRLQWDSIETAAYSFYNNQLPSISNYGFLYNFYSIEDSSGLCPYGWKIPGSSDWETLIKFLGGESLSGEKLKDHSQGRWIEGGIGKGVTEVGFGAIPAGYRDSNGDYHDLGKSANFWSKENIDAVTAETFDLEYDFTNLLRGLEDKKNGLSVRCVKE